MMIFYLLDGHSTMSYLLRSLICFSKMTLLHSPFHFMKHTNSIHRMLSSWGLKAIVLLKMGSVDQRIGGIISNRCTIRKSCSFCSCYDECYYYIKSGWYMFSGALNWFSFWRQHETYTRTPECLCWRKDVIETNNVNKKTSSTSWLLFHDGWILVFTITVPKNLCPISKWGKKSPKYSSGTKRG